METQQFYRPLLCEISWCLLPLRVTPVYLVRSDPQRDPMRARKCHFDRGTTPRLHERVSDDESFMDGRHLCDLGYEDNPRARNQSLESLAIFASIVSVSQVA